MTIYRCIAPNWLMEENPDMRRVREGEFSDEVVNSLNQQGYNIYSLPNYPSSPIKGKPVDGSQIDVFKYLYVDMDLKDAKYPSKEAFLETIFEFPLEPSRIVDSGGGVHVYWEVSDLNANSYLRLQRRLMREFDTDPAVGQIYQLMRVPGTWNTKLKDNWRECRLLLQCDTNVYTAEQVDALLPPITVEDEQHCIQHFEKTYNLESRNVQVDDKLPEKFCRLLADSPEVKEIWKGNTDDRSKADYRLGHILFANSFTKDEARSVLVNTAKALERAPQHRVNYAENILDKIWTFEISKEDAPLDLSSSVGDILHRRGENLKGVRFACHDYIDATEHGFRLGQVIGLVAGSGVGKTAMALNMFMGFVKNNPGYIHFFVPLEQPSNEIAERWKTMCGDNTALHDKVHVISNYAEDGSFRHLSLDDIRLYLLKFREKTNLQPGCVVIDHIGALKKKSENGENQGLMDICHSMKAFAIQTNTMLVMQSQAPREKAGIGDLELDKDAAYGTVFFESYCDYLITIWQPLKRCYSDPACPTVTAFKFCKIRHKKKGLDKAQEDTPYRLRFDPNTELFQPFTQKDEKSFEFWVAKATNKRKQDKKTDILTYKSTSWVNGESSSGQTNHS